jgi:hypothetical protein
VFAKRNFRNGGANLLVCLDFPQGIATISEITFGNQSNHGAHGVTRPASLDLLIKASF